MTKILRTTHYETIARVLKTERRFFLTLYNNAHNDEQRTQFADKADAVTHVAHALAEELALTNVKFNHRVFIDLCGVDTN